MSAAPMTPSPLAPPSTETAMGPGTGLGPLFVGILILFALFGLLTVQMYIYCLTQAADKRLIRALVYGVYILLVVQVAMCGQDGFVRFTSMSQSPGNGIGLGWFFIPVLGGLVGLGVQTFYAWRIFILSQSKIGPFFIVALSFGSATAAFTSAVYGARVKSVQQLGSSQGIRISTGIWYSTSAACDLVIAAYMTFLLTRSRSYGTESTRRLVARIVRLTIETNALTTALAVTTTVLLLGPKNQIYYSVFSLILPSVYGNTLMIMLNLRLKFTRSDTQIKTTSVSDASGSLGNVSSQISRNQCRCGRLSARPSSIGMVFSAAVPASPIDEFRATKSVQNEDFHYSMQDFRSSRNNGVV